MARNSEKFDLSGLSQTDALRDSDLHEVTTFDNLWQPAPATRTAALRELSKNDKIGFYFQDFSKD